MLIFTLLFWLTQLSNKVPNIIDYSIPELVAKYPELRKVAFADDQEVLPELLKNVGEGVEVLFRDIPNTCSVEDVRSEVLDPQGNVVRIASKRFQYLLIAHRANEKADAGGKSGSNPGKFAHDSVIIEEFRTSPNGKEENILEWTNSFVVTKDFASIPLYLHPLYRDETKYRYLGRDADGTHVIAFAQDPAIARIHGSAADMTGKTLPTFLHGFVWVDPQTYQILRMRTDSLPGIDSGDLRYATTHLTFENVSFSAASRSLRLPHEVLVLTEWLGGIRVRNRHRYSNYRLFTVNAEENKNRSILKKPGSE